jgi:hypothetical protein
VRRLLGLLVQLVVLALGWVAVRGYLAYGHAKDAVAGLSDVQQAVTTGDVETARTQLSDVQADTRAARRLTSDPIWNAVAAFPFGGQNLEAFSTAVRAADGVTHVGLPALLKAAEGLGDFTSGLESGDLDADALQRTADGVRTLDRSLARAREQVDGIDHRYLLPPVEQGVSELEQALDVATQVREVLAGQVPVG